MKLLSVGSCGLIIYFGANGRSIFPSIYTLIVKVCVYLCFTPHLSPHLTPPSFPPGWCTLSMGLPVLSPVWPLLCARLSKTMRETLHCHPPSTPTCLAPPRSTPGVPPAIPLGSGTSHFRGPSCHQDQEHNSTEMLQLS